MAGGGYTPKLYSGQVKQAKVEKKKEPETPQKQERETFVDLKQSPTQRFKKPMSDMDD